MGEYSEKLESGGRLVVNEKDWYKIKLENNEFGWILKSCAKIYFENEYGGARDKIEILKSINQ